jgi:hypothetical protein
VKRFEFSSFAVTLICITGCLVITQDSTAEDASFSEAELEFFEKKIRPVLAQHCYQCHSAKAAKSDKLRGGLLVDTREGLLKGGDSGPAAEPQQVEGSVLLEALRYESNEMPPKGKLPAAVIADFTKWVEMGLPDPRKGTEVKTNEIDVAAGRTFWSYRELAKPKIPHVANTEIETPIDAFVWAELKKHKLAQLGLADRTTLVRRLYFDLTGLPPTPAQIDAFVSDESPAAYERLVDQLLASPRFGERWGRHWLDIARFAESITLRGFVLPEAWRYRDYVIHTFNADRSFQHFIKEQVAGDLLPADTIEQRSRNLIATTFLTLGNTNLEDQDKKKLRMDVVDEQLETIGRGFLAQTIGCARCHDHKFDPIPTKDYYALAGILRNTKTLNHSNVSMWLELPLPVAPELKSIYNTHDLAVAKLNDEIKAIRGKLNPVPTKSGIVTSDKLQGIVVDDADATYEGKWVSSVFEKTYVEKGYRHDNTAANGLMSATFIPPLKKSGRYQVRFAYTAAAGRASNVPVTVISSAGETTVKVNERLAPTLDGHFVSLGEFDLEVGKDHRVVVRNEATDGVVIVDAVQFISTDEAGEPANPAAVTQLKDSNGQLVEQQRIEKAKLADRVKELELELKTLNQNAPKRPKYMTVQEEAKSEDAKIHIRGDVHNLGADVPRGFLQVASYGESIELPANQSGRVELGEWLARADNPLTARVLANRTWHWLFGSGIVRTTDNFGATGELPSHPQLLDYLAARLVEGEWSVKRLVREIVLSRTYRLSSSVDSQRDAVAIAADPANRLLWRMNRRRLDAECFLDSMLLISSDLRLEIGGKTMGKPATDYDYAHKNTGRRAVYWPIFRNSVPRILDVFDFANPSMVVGQRNVSNTAPQSLFIMNNPLLLDQSEKTARRLLEAGELTDQQRTDRLFRQTLGRLPSEGERTAVLSFIESVGTGKRAGDIEAWAQVVHGLIGSTDFRYLK